MPEENLDRFLRQTMRQEAEAHAERLTGLEERVLLRLSEVSRERPEPHRPARWGWAAATAFAGLLVGVAIGYLTKPGGREVALATHRCVAQDESVSLCQFIVFDSQAKSLTLTGSFTGWAQVALQQVSPGVWTGEFALERGVPQRYAFVIDGQNWRVYSNGCNNPTVNLIWERQECVLNL
jgi:hypothetical protein